MSQENYFVQPELYAERDADYSEGEYLNSVFTPITQDEIFKDGTTSGNLSYEMAFKKNSDGSLAFEVLTGDKFDSVFGKKATHIRESYVISSALALYRLVCMFNKPIVECLGAAGYKVPWTLGLKHNATGTVINMREWKGAFGFGTKFGSVDDAPKEFLDDLCRLMNLLVSDRSPHPYDGVTAGGVA